MSRLVSSDESELGNKQSCELRSVSFTKDFYLNPYKKYAKHARVSRDSKHLGDGQLGDGQLGNGQLGDGQLGDGHVVLDQLDEYPCFDNEKAVERFNSLSRKFIQVLAADTCDEVYANLSRIHSDKLGEGNLDDLNDEKEFVRAQAAKELSHLPPLPRNSLNSTSSGVSSEGSLISDMSLEMPEELLSDLIKSNLVEG